ncbi:L-aspartate oxidase [Corynebacterium sp. H113]|uniref:L-aspartate oxidase n=1 Tax=Corynebacterium sp. H113 TaxID=3133419 RepID=UPI0030ADDAC7
MIPSPSGYDWDLSCDLLIIGAGVAGLSAARRGRELGLDVLLVDKGEWRTGARSHLRFDTAATNLAQGGLAVVGLADDPTGHLANGIDDSVESHVADTLDAGAGHCDEDAVRSIIGGAGEAVEWLIGLGAEFDPDPTHPEVLSRTREGGHSARRIIHAGGDATGAEIQRALEASVSGIRVLQNAAAEDIVVDDSRRATGALIRDPRGLGCVTSTATLIATGGVGHLYRSTTAPEGAFGDGLCLALDAGATLADMEFIQFHPTVLFDRDRRGRRPLISEAVRGEGARLVDSRGKSVTDGVDPRGDLAPRDIVSRAVATRMSELGDDCVYLDARHIPDVCERFPTVTAGVATAGLNPATDLLPVAPAVHYTCGGIDVDVHGRTCVPQLYAGGECSRTGLHGANRLASNSLLEGLVVGKRVAEDAAWVIEVQGADKNPAALPWPAEACVKRAGRPARSATGRRRPRLSARNLDKLQQAMTRGAGVTRNAESLASVAAVLATLPAAPQVVVAKAIVAAAAQRPYTLGCHTWLE